MTIEELRRFAVARSLFAPTTLRRALNKLGFVQADPIRSPARAQDLTLRHRVRGYRAGDLERSYSKLDIEEDYFVNYGFVTQAVHALMHPRANLPAWKGARRKQAEAVLEFVRENGPVHPRIVDDHFAHGTVRNYWGGTSNATTHLLDALHYRGLLRVVGREGGTRIYAARPLPADTANERAGDADLDALVDVVVGLYAPLPQASLSGLVSRLRHCVPQWQGSLKTALRRAKQRLAHTRVDSVDWYWPAQENPFSAQPEEDVRLLAPFDPVVWDRRRFELFWGWAYRFEAYTPVAKRKLGYYALPLLWRDQVIGWGNLSLQKGELQSEIGFIRPEAANDAGFATALELELDRMRAFLQR